MFLEIVTPDEKVFEGEVISEGLLIIEEEAEIQAKITSDEAGVQGKGVGLIFSKKKERESSG